MGFFRNLKAGIQIGKIELLSREIFQHLRNYKSYSETNAPSMMHLEKLDIVQKLSDLYSLSKPLKDRASKLPIKTDLIPGGTGVLSLYLINLVMELTDLETNCNIGLISEDWKELFIELCETLPGCQLSHLTFYEAVNYMNEVAKKEGF